MSESEDQEEQFERYQRKFRDDMDDLINQNIDENDFQEVNKKTTLEIDPLTNSVEESENQDN